MVANKQTYKQTTAAFFPAPTSAKVNNKLCSQYL